jgi:hypothetical protein
MAGRISAGAQHDYTSLLLAPVLRADGAGARILALEDDPCPL